MCERVEYERHAYQLGKQYIIGLDEAGRGPMAGPLVVAGVIFPKGYVNNEINDSKKLSEKKREKLFDIIKHDALAYQIEIISIEDVDKLNVYQASRLGMINAIKHISIQPDYALSDAMPLGDVIEHEAIIKGDSKSISIGAASILAKVTRDHIMLEYDKQYPEYGFASHKGYPTKQHKEALQKYGVTPIHRRSFQPVKDALTIQLTIDSDEFKL
ncbi:MAG: ribonuclease HII [Erysipelotrichaceae bacterium]|nr:ribonuclease HII [Erysipelotrichaceae bacterium]